MDYWGGGGGGGGGGGAKGMLAPPLKLLGGLGPPWPPLFLRLCLFSEKRQEAFITAKGIY